MNYCLFKQILLKIYINDTFDMVRCDRTLIHIKNWI